jgi:VIT1/CCC1 family predicted Fe2+/Mn2+ transporter
MKHVTFSDRVLDTSSLVGIMGGLAMLLAAFFVPDIAALAAPACIVLVASLLCGMR